MNIRHTLAALMLVASFSLIGCERSDAPAPKKQSPPKTPATQVTMAECLPCQGHKIEVTADIPRVEHAGKTYYFCSTACKESFVKDPARYLASASTSRPTAN